MTYTSTAKNDPTAQKPGGLIDRGITKRGVVVMSAPAQIYAALSDVELADLFYRDVEAAAAILEAQIIADSGGWPEISYSDIHGYHVRDRMDHTTLVN